MSRLLAVAVAAACITEQTVQGPFRQPPFLLAQIPSAAPAMIMGDVRLAGTNAGGVASVDVWTSDAATGLEVSRDQTDRDGRFLLSVPPGRYIVSAGRAGYLSSHYGSLDAELPGTPIALAAGQRREILLSIRRGATVSGVVRDENGRVIRNASVAFLRQVDLEGAPDERAVTRASTDLDGVYQAYGLRPGRYLVTAMVDRQPVGPSNSRLYKLAAQFYPGAAHEDLATPLVLSADEDKRGVDFTLQYSPVTHIAGLLVASGTNAALDESVIVITVVRTTHQISEPPRLISGNTFDIHLQPGRYRFDIRAVSQNPSSSTGQRYYSSAVVDVPDVRSFKYTFSLHRGLGVSGRVVAMGGQTAALAMRLVPRSGGRPAINPVELAPNHDGYFRVEDVAPGRYVIELIPGSRLWQLETVRFRGKDQRELDIDAEVSAEELEVVVGPRTSSLAGQIVGAGQTVSSYLLAMVPIDQPLRLHSGVPNVYLTRADDTGRYAFSYCRAGSYLITMLRDMDAADVHSTSFLENLRKDTAAVPVILSPNTDSTLNLSIR